VAGTWGKDDGNLVSWKPGVRKPGVRLARLQDQVPAGGFTVKDFSMAIITAIRNVSGKIFIRYKR
jgi:hypothetical protein